MHIRPALNFNGQCEEAFRTYERVLGGSIEGFFRYGDSPMADRVGKDWSGKIMHVTMHIGDQVVIGADAPGDQFQKPQGFSVCIDLGDESEAERVYRDLSEGGQIQMALTETFWAKRFAMFIDRFGTPWMINASKPM